MKKIFTVFAAIVAFSFSVFAEDIYLIGSATSAGWTIADAVQMSYDSEDNTYSWSGKLKFGTFKFVTSTTDWWPAYTAPDADTVIEGGEQQFFQLTYNDSEKDYKFIAYPGTYNMTIYWDDETPMLAVTATLDPWSIDKTSLQIVGSATPNAWTPTDMVESESGVFKYEGTLTEGEFKFRWASDWWPALLAKYNNFAIEDISADTPLFYAPADVDGMDYKFSVSSEADWEITVDLNNLTISASQATATSESVENAINVYVTETGIVIVGDATSYIIYDITGSVVAAGEISDSEVSIAVPAGIYIVKTDSSVYKVKK